MSRQTDFTTSERDESLGEAIESFLELAERGSAPDPDEFASRYPEISSELRAALDGLELVQGMVGACGHGVGLESGRRIAGYRIVRELGRGGMGIVYEAVHVDLDRPVALKILGLHSAPDSSGRRRFIDEAKTAAALHHTHIVPVFDVGQVGGICYYAMQRIEGSGLDRVIKALRRTRTTAAGSTTGSTIEGECVSTQSWAQSLSDSAAVFRTIRPRADRPVDEGPPFEPPRGAGYFTWVARVGEQAAAALAHAHRRGIVHRDIKPSNLLIDDRGMIWIADFGLALRLSSSGAAASENRQGTPRYMSPEQAAGRPVDARTDVYSLGATLYELVSLRPPFDGRTTAELTEKIQNAPLLSPREIATRLPRDLDAIIRKAMARDPAERYGSSQDLADDLGRYLRMEPVLARPIGPAERFVKLARRHPALSAITSIAAAAIFGVATFAYARILHERNAAVSAGHVTQRALRDTQQAVLEKDQALAEKSEALAESSLKSVMNLRLAGMTSDRRARGIDLIRTALANRPSAETRRQLRDEAIEILASRDLEPRTTLNASRGWGLLQFTRDGNQLVTYAPELQECVIWDYRAGKETGRFSTRSENDPGFAADDFGPRLSGFRQIGGGALIDDTLAMLRPDGRELRLFDISTGRRMAEMNLPEGHTFVTIRPVPNRRELIAIEPRRPGGDVRGMPTMYAVGLWDPKRLDAGPLVRYADSNDDGGWEFFPTVLTSPDARTLVIHEFRTEMVSIYDLATGALRRELDAQVDIGGLALGPDGLLAIAGGGSVRIWNIDDPSPVFLREITPNQMFVSTMRFSPDGSLLALVGWSGEQVVEVWDLASKSLVAGGRTGERGGSDLVFSPDGRALLASGSVKTVVWDLVEPVGLQRISGLEQQPTSVAFGPDGRLAIAFGNRHPLRVLTPGECLSRWIDCESAEESQFTLDDRGRILLLATDRIERLEFPAKAGHDGQPGPAEGSRLKPISSAIVPETLVRLSGAMPTPPRASRESRGDGPGRSAPAGPPAQTPRGTRGGPPQPAMIARSGDGRVVVFGRLDDAYLWRASEPNRVTLIELPARRRGGFGFKRGYAVSNSGERLYILDNDGQLDAYFIQSDGGIRSLGWSGIPHGTALSLAPSGRYLAMGDIDGRILVIDVESGKASARPFESPVGDGGTVRVLGLAFSPLGDELAASYADGTVRLVAVGADGSCERRVKLPGTHLALAPNPLAFDSTGGRLAVIGDRSVSVWDLARLREELNSLGLGW